MTSKTLDLFNNPYPTMEEQMSVLNPELQSALFDMEEIYKKRLEEAKTVRKNIIDLEGDVFKANIRCGDLTKFAVNIRYITLKSLREKWGDFFYNT